MRTAVVGGLVILATVLLAPPARALVVGGGGPVKNDCLVVFDVDANFPLSNPSHVRCVDGDAACDDDLTKNGYCSIRVKVCANNTSSSECTASGLAQIDVDHSVDNGTDRKFDPDFLALRQRIESELVFPVTTDDTCTSTVIITVPIKGPIGDNNCSKRKKKLKLRSLSQVAAGPITDVDTLKLRCEPSPLDGCDPQTLFNSTFDRIQQQVFNQSSALGSCHDSESMANGLLLETGAAHGNLVNQTPTNGAADAAGWLRVRAVAPGVSGDSETSYLYHKLIGDLPDASYGARMPLDRPRVHATLREVIRLWIEAGAPPDDGTKIWVPGTF